jgi:serine/threonine protein kinase
MTAEQPFPADCAARFKLIKRLSAGGFGAVYLAHQKGLDRPVAIKLLLETMLEDAEQVQRFLNEARITASISHPCVVVLIDHGADHGIPWIAYEYLPGRNLRQLIDAGSMRWEDAVEAMFQVADGVSAGHDLKILHRDIEPENVLQMEDRSRFKIADFGIAKWSGLGRVKTRTGIIMGTPAYLSPEQISGLEASSASDVYALGVMLFELLIGHPPYRHDNYLVVLEQHLHGAIPLPSRYRPDLPAELDAIVERAMAKDPADRFPDAASLRTELQKVRAVPLTSEPGLARIPQASQVAGATVRVLMGLKGDRPTAHASAAGRRMPRSAFALAVLATALGLLVVTRSWRSDPSPSMTPTMSPTIAPHGEYEKWAADFVRRLDRPRPPDATRAAWAVADIRRLTATGAIRLQDPKDQRRFCVAAMMEIADRGELMFMRKGGADRPTFARDVGDLVGDFVQAGRMAFETIGEGDPSILKNPTTHYFLKDQGLVLPTRRAWTTYLPTCRRCMAMHVKTAKERLIENRFVDDLRHGIRLDENELQELRNVLHELARELGGATTIDKDQWGDHVCEWSRDRVMGRFDSVLSAGLGAQPQGDRGRLSSLHRQSETRARRNSPQPEDAPLRPPRPPQP